MKIFVKTPKASSLEIEVKPQHTVADVRKIVEAVHGDAYPASLHSLTHQGKVLKDMTTLEENRVTDNSLILIKGLPKMGENVGGSNLEFLRNNPQFLAMRAKVQENPQLLQPMVEELGKQNPQLILFIQENQAEFLRLVNEPTKVMSSHQQPPQKKPVVAVEEDALKRNTDCVYFLASPLTCKKGSECEYRHSEYARVNPRDCWYWLNSTCLNPKCAFRHPPIEGLVGAPATPSAVSAPSSSQAAVAPEALGPQNPSKVGVACLYFQKGYCMKGDRCSFSHGQNPTTNVKVTQQPLAPTMTHGSAPSSTAKKPIVGGLQKCTVTAQEQKLLPQVSTAKPFGGAPPVANRVLKIETALPRNVPARKPFDEEHVLAKAASSTSMTMNGISTNRLSRLHQVHALVGDHGFQNGKDGDEFMRESSPGFDVLVEDEVGEQDYFQGEDQYGRSREFDLDQTDDFGPIADGEQDRFRDPRSYESYDRVQGKFAREQHRASLSSERMVVGVTQFDRRGGGGGYRESNSPDNGNSSDLRHRLSKKRRVNGLRSVTRHDEHNDNRNYRIPSRRDPNPVQRNKAPVSSRLRGRINFGSSANGGDPRELERGRRAVVSANQPQPAPAYQGRFRDRLKDRVQEDDGRNIRGSGESFDFTGPKGLSELRSVTGSEVNEQSIRGKRKNTRAEGSQRSEGDDPSLFEGPKSLSEILKRKREARGAASVETPPKSSSANVVETKDKSVEDLDGVSSEAALTAAPNANEHEVEDGIIYDDEVIDDQELEEADDQAHEEYHYEQVEEEEEEEGEYDVEGEDEYLEDEEDDFAKKIGVVSSSS